MIRFAVPLKGLLVPGLLVAAFVLAGCFSSGDAEVSTTAPSGGKEVGSSGGSSSDTPESSSQARAASIPDSDSTEIDAAEFTDSGLNSTAGLDSSIDQSNDSNPTAARGKITQVALAEPAKKTALEKSSTGKVSSDKTAPNKPGSEYVDRPPTPLLKGWTKPAVAIVLSGDQRGSLEPCGCTARQSGGFARRGDLFEQLWKKGWPVVALDLGGSLKRSRTHDQIKFEKILDGMRRMKYDAMGLGPAELRLGAERLMSWHEPEPNGDTPGLPFLSANIVFFENPDQGTPLPYRIIEANGLKIGVTSVLGDAFRDQVIPRGPAAAGQPISVAPAIPALKSAVEKMKELKPDLMVLLSYGMIDETKQFAKQVPDFDIILTAGGAEEPLDRTEQLGKATLIQVGAKGKHVAILGYYPDAPQKLKFELVELDKFRFKNDPAMVQLMQDFQDDLKDADLATNEQQIPHASGAGFAGAKKCGECHKKAFAKWSTTKHAHAYESLIKGRPDYEGKWVSRVNDVECLACHVTGWDPQEVVPFETGFRSPESTPHLLGQQCENCHGPGTEHVKQEEIFLKTRRANDPKLLKWRQKMHMDQALAQTPNGCFKCHDGDNSPKFKFADYFKQIQHIGRD